MNQNADWFFDKDTKWQKEYQKLRTIVLDCGLIEELKWGVPCYTFRKKNTVLIHGFKNYCALLFHKGVLLKDPNTILIQQTVHVQAARQIRFTNLQEINKLQQVIRSYLVEAIEIEKAGLEVKMKKTSEFEVPVEFKNALNGSAELQSAFYGLTPGRQRGYLLHFSQAKQSKTRIARIDKCRDKIRNGIGLNEAGSKLISKKSKGNS